MIAPRIVNGQRGQAFQAFVKVENRNTLSFIFLTILILVIGGEAKAQRGGQAKSFKEAHRWVNPLSLPPLLSGNFGELRGNHFHTGVDLKTEGREGFPVLAATDGRVARIKMSPWGYGNALYLEGPDGITTVYAHLQRFAPEVQDWAVERTYAGRTLGLDASPPSEAGLTFHAGDTLGWSGNSGGSGGPHLHFEIRATGSQHPLNPLDGWLDKVDKRPPVLPSLWLETTSGRVQVLLPAADTLRLFGRTRFALEGYDLLDGASNVCGLRELNAEVRTTDGRVLLEHEVSWGELDFAVNRDMNAHTLFAVWETRRDQVHRLHRLPTNRLGIYSTPSGSGWVELAPGERAVLHAEAVDAAGNSTAVDVALVGGAAQEGGLVTGGEVDRSPQGAKACVTPVNQGDMKFRGFVLSWASGTFYETDTLGFEVDLAGRQVDVFPNDVPYRKPVEMRWPVPSSAQSWEGSWAVLPGASVPIDRWLAIRRSDNGDVEETAVADWDDPTWTVQLPSGGRWSLERDTVAPKVMPYHSGTPLTSEGNAVWYVDDELSGIASVELTLNGQWLRGVWDPKRNMLTYEGSDGRHPSGKPCLVALTVTDEVGNQTRWERTLVWP